ncbi:MAG TPA: ATP-binding protein [Jatrophihabitans sp.]|jgi:hypothetical protein|uniref:sensor histidine kinase n=1 Tax=Jatrophihabitans sp. TaxID=1932789 RepID=UPI002E0C169B|nr:ATP-binding protein [Jatrophihabitans sp.]
MTIRLRLALVFVVATLAMLGLSEFVFVRSLESNLERDLNTTLEARASTIIATVEGRSLTSTDVRRAPIRLNPINGVVAQLVDVHGIVLDSTRATRIDRLVSPSVAAVAQRKPVFVDEDVHLSASDETDADAGSTVAMRVYARRAGSSDIIVAVGIARTEVDTAAGRARQQLVIFGSVVLVLSGLGAWLLIRAALRPVERMRREAANLHERNAGAGVRVPDTRDEIARLGHTLNRLLARLQQAVAREREFVADAGHELRTPLTVLKGELELARRPGRTREQLAETIEVAAQETDRLVRLTDDLLRIGRSRETDAPAHASFDVAAVVRSAARALTPTAAAQRVTIVVPAEATEVSADGDAEAIRQAVDNLLSNAIRHSPPASSITVEVDDDDADVRIAVSDEGPGFPQAFLPVAFERFSRADEARGRDAEAGPDQPVGSGLGLAIVRSIMTAHHGTASIGTRADGRTEVVLRWPRTDPTRATPTPVPTKGAR